MIAKNIKGKSFKGCVQYVMNEAAELLEAEGVWADNTKDIIRSFAMQRFGRKERDKTTCGTHPHVIRSGG